MQPRSRRMQYQRPICLVPEGALKPVRVSASDLSSGGMLVRGDLDVTIGTAVQVKLETRLRDLPLATARVVWSSRSGTDGEAQVGLQFTDFAHPRTCEMLQSHLEPRPPAEKPVREAPKVAAPPDLGLWAAVRAWAEQLFAMISALFSSVART